MGIIMAILTSHLQTLFQVPPRIVHRLVVPATVVHSKLVIEIRQWDQTILSAPAKLQIQSAVQHGTELTTPRVHV